MPLESIVDASFDAGVRFYDRCMPPSSNEVCWQMNTWGARYAASPRTAPESNICRYAPDVAAAVASDIARRRENGISSATVLLTYPDPHCETVQARRRRGRDRPVFTSRLARAYRTRGHEMKAGN
jgi:hypothetical protein